MLLRGGLLLSCLAVFLQIAVFLQPLLPKQYQVAPVCETITRALLLQPTTSHQSHHPSSHHTVDQDSQLHNQDAGHHHDANHQCQYCTVYGNLVLPPELNIKEVLVRIQIRLLE